MLENFTPRYRGIELVVFGVPDLAKSPFWDDMGF